MSAGDIRQEEGKPTAAELYAAHVDANGNGWDAGWPRFCASSDYCTTPCTECAREGRLAKEAAERLGL